MMMQKDRIGYRSILLDGHIIGEIQRRTHSRWDGTLWLSNCVIQRHAGTAQDAFHALKTAHYWYLREKQREAVLEQPQEVRLGVSSEQVIVVKA
jgi:hypothetical protein